MSKFKSKKEKGLPAISTASLPDIVFMLLFFFMVATVFRDKEIMVKVQPPTAGIVEKMENKSLVGNIFIGVPQDKYVQGDPVPMLQLNDKLSDVAEVGAFISEERGNLDPNEIPGYVISIKGDSDLDMKIINDVKEELRKQYQLKINYAALEGDVANNFN